MINHRNYSLFFAVLWVLWFALHVLCLRGLGFNWNLSLADSLLSNGSLVLVCLILTFPLKYYHPNKSNVWQLGVWVAVITALWYVAIMPFFSDLPFADQRYLAGLAHTKMVRLAIALLIICFTVLLRWMTGMAQEQRDLEQRQQQIEQLSRNTELSTLRQQLHPHFLFNTLNSVSALIPVKPIEARKMVLQLSDFLRSSVQKQDKKRVSVSDEIKQIELYLAIEEVRFGHRLVVDIAVADQCLDKQIPPFILQPLVENAIKYGLYDTTEQVYISLRVDWVKEELRISISNPYDHKTSDANNGTGFGQQSVQRRLFLMFGRNDLFVVDRDEANYTVQVIIPQ